MTTDTTITPELLDQLLANYEKPEDLTGEDGLFKQLKKALIERALGAELTRSSRLREGRSGRPRQRQQPQRHQREDDPDRGRRDRDRGAARPGRQLRAAARSPRARPGSTASTTRSLSLYARGMTVREIQGHLAELYGAEVSPDLISRVTDAVLDEVREWQNRPLDPVYPVVFFDALRVKIRDEGLVKNKAVYVALALNPDGEKEVLGPVDRADRRRQVLAQGHQRAEDARRQRHPDRRGRRAQGLSRGDHRRSFRRPWCRPASCT